MIKGIIFDLDGVIVSTDSLHYQAWKTITEQEGILFNEKMNNLLRGVSRMESLDIILKNTKKRYSNDEKIELANRKNNIYIKVLDNLSKEDVIDGILDLLLQLKNNGFKIAIGSSSKNAKLILKKIQLFDLFEAISDGTNITNSKPNPEVFIIAAQMLHLRNCECAVVEDAHSGIAAAKSANMMSFAYGDAVTSLKKDYNLDEIYNVLNLK